MPAETLLALIESHNGGVTLLEHSGKIEPLIALYDRSLAGKCEAILRTEQTSVRRLLDLTPVKTVAYTGDEALLTNCNTPETYQALLALL